LQSHAPVDDHAVHEHHPRQQHHFDTMAHQYEASSFGMWVFLIQEVMFFGGLFVAYLVYRNMYYTAFGTASESLNVTLGLFNTVVLIGSSLTMAFAVNAAQLGRKKLLILYILATMVLGSIFLGVKAIEYTQKWEAREIPGSNFCFHAAGEPCRGIRAHDEKIPDVLKRWAHGDIGPTVQVGSAHESASVHAETPEVSSHIEQAPGRTLEGGTERERSMKGAEIYFSLYFAMTGMHALHMVIGMGIMLWLLVNALRGVYSEVYFTTIENFGLYWHFVDIIWIYLFPLLYLINRHLGAHH
jgi:cytochrome c oxidase subunit 3